MNSHRSGTQASVATQPSTSSSEQLGRLWEVVDFEAGLIRIRRIQLRDGALAEVTKTGGGAPAP